MASGKSNDECERVEKGGANPFQLSVDTPHRQQQQVSIKIDLLKFLDIMPWFSCVIYPVESKVITLLKSLPPAACRFNSHSASWEIALSVYQRLVNELTASHFSSYVRLSLPPQFLMRREGLPRWYEVNKRMQDEFAQAGGVQLNFEGTSLDDNLLAYQRLGVEFVVRRGGRAFIGDDMGLGKTIQAVAVLAHYRQHWPALILMPPGLVQTWSSHIDDHVGNLIRPEEVTVVKNGKAAVTRPGSKVTLMPHSLIGALVKANKIKPGMFGIAIVDESHKLKNHTAEITKAALPIIKSAKVAVCLSGTPSPNAPAELFTQLSALLPSMFRSYDEYVSRYCNAQKIKAGAGKEFTRLGASNKEELATLLKGVVMIRRQKIDVLKELPQKKRELVKIVLSDEAMEGINLVKAEKDSVLRKLHNASDHNKAHLEAELQRLTNKLWMVTGEAKVPSFFPYLQSILEEQNEARQRAETEADLKVESLRKRGAGDLVAAAADVESDVDVDEMTGAYLAEARAEEAAGSALSNYAGLENHQEDWGSFSPPSSHTEGATTEKPNPAVTPAASFTKTEIVDLSADALQESVTLSCIEDDGVVFVGSTRAKDVPRGLQSLSDSPRAPTVGEISLMPLKYDENALSAKQAIVSLHHKSQEKEETDSEGELKEDSDDSLAPRFRKEETVIDTSSDDDHFSTRPKNRAHSSKKKKRGSGDAPSAGKRAGRGKGKREVPGVLSSSDEESTASGGGWEALKARGAKAAARVKASRPEAHNDTPFVDDTEGMPARRRERDKRCKNMPKSSESSETKDNGLILGLAAKKHHRKLGRKVLVFGHHQSVLDQIEDWLKIQDVGFVRLDGKSNVQKRGPLVKQFQEDDDTLVALCGITAVGTGYTLTRANIALFPEVVWSMGNMEQCEDRVHRIGQTAEEVRIIYYFAAGTGDDSVYRSLENKRDMVGGTVGLSGASAVNKQQQAHFSAKDSSRGKPLQMKEGASGSKSPQRQTTMSSFMGTSRTGPASSVYASMPPARAPLPLSAPVASDSQASFNYGNDLEMKATGSMAAPAPAPAPAPARHQVKPSPRPNATAVYTSMASAGGASDALPSVPKVNKGDELAPTSLQTPVTAQGGKRPLSPKTRTRMEENRKKALRLQAERRAQARPQRRSGSLSTGKGQPVTIDVTALSRAEQVLNGLPPR